MIYLKAYLQPYSLVGICLKVKMFLNTGVERYIDPFKHPPITYPLAAKTISLK